MDSFPKNLSIRLATIDDCALISSLIRQHAEYEKASESQLSVSPDLIKANVFEHKFCEFLIAKIDAIAVGFSCFFHNFSTWLGKPGIWIEDLFVLPEYRKQKIGAKIVQRMAQICEERGCMRLDWTVMTWNENALGFYKKIGGKTMDDWVAHRLDEEGIKKLANMKI